MSTETNRPGGILGLLAVLAVLGIGAPAQAGTKLYSATLIIHAFGNDNRGSFTAFPLGAYCGGTSNFGGGPCGESTIQRGKPLSGMGTVSTFSITTNFGTTNFGPSPGAFMLPASEFSRTTNGSRPWFQPSTPSSPPVPNPFLYDLTYAALRNQAGSFHAGGGPGSFSVFGPATPFARVSVKQGPNRFGGTLRLLGSLQSRSLRSGPGGLVGGTIDWKFDIVGATAPTIGGMVIGGYQSLTGALFYNYSLFMSYTKLLVGSAFPWTTGSVTVTALRYPTYPTYPTYTTTPPYTSYSYSFLQRKGYDNRTTMGQGTIQLVSPMLTHWLEQLGTRTTAAIAVLRIEFVDPPSPDSDDDGLPDSVETNTGVFVDANDTGTDPLNFDSDADGLSDGAEVNGFGSNPNVSETAVVFSHLDDTNPTDPGEAWTLTGSGTGVLSGPLVADMVEVEDMSFDAWVVDDNSTVAGSILGYLHTPGPTPGVGWVLRGRTRILDLGPEPPPLDENASVHLEYSDGTTGYAMNLRANLAGDPVVFLEGGGGSVTLEDLGDGYHLYELVFDPAASPPSADLFVNGVERLSDYTGFARSLTRVVWGSFQSTTTGEGRYNRVEWSTFDASLDRDGDGLLDSFEIANGFDPLVAGEQSQDPDADGLINLAEQAAGTDPNDPDTDDDGLLDGEEFGTGLFGPQQLLTNTASGAISVFAADVDGDGDLDVLSASIDDDTVGWFENTDGVGGFGSRQVISSSADGAYSVFAIDVDGDDDTDVLSADANAGAVAWYENTDGVGGFGSRQVISALASGARDVHGADIDGDGDADVVSGSFADNKVAWYENTDGVGGFGAQQVISTAAQGPWSVYVADLDGDLDDDVLSASFSDWEVAWYENSDGAGNFGAQQIISTAGEFPFSVVAADLDGDGDMDVVAGSFQDSEIAWYENTDGLGSFGTQQIISTLANSPHGVFAVDLDSDGDVDVLSAAFNDHEIAWHENTDGAGSFGTQQIITGLTFQATDVHAADLDGDGDVDVLSASQGDNEIAWYEQLNLADPLDPDSDDDGLLDGFEVTNGFDPLVPGEQSQDPDADGLDNLAEQTAGTDPNDADSDDDGLVDGDEVNVHASDPLDPDSDDDGLNDGAEVALGSDPLEPDSDGDGVCDGGNQVGSCTAPGPDNCPLVPNPDQMNSDSLPEGNACQCGDVNDDDVVDAADRVSFQSWLVGNSSGGVFIGTRCNVIGPSEPAPGFGCDVADIFVISRFVDGAPVSVGNDCPAFRPELP